MNDCALNGILDPLAPSIRAEYVRYLDLDLLGKIITRSLFLNRLGYSPSVLHIPLGRYGDAKVKYAKPGAVVRDLGDGHIETDQGIITFEVKCARINIANRSRGYTAENWAFQGLLTSPGKSDKKYDVLIAIGIRQLGLEDQRYWGHLQAMHQYLQSEGRPSNIDAWPHEAAFLSLCSFFIVARTHIVKNYFRINVRSIEKRKYAECQAWGYDEERCRAVWQEALETIRGDCPLD
jgi:hypothetical protein